MRLKRRETDEEDSVSCPVKYSTDVEWRSDSLAVISSRDIHQPVYLRKLVIRRGHSPLLCGSRTSGRHLSIICVLSFASHQSHSTALKSRDSQFQVSKLYRRESWIVGSQCRQQALHGLSISKRLFKTTTYSKIVLLVSQLGQWLSSAQLVLK